MYIPLILILWSDSLHEAWNHFLTAYSHIKILKVHFLSFVPHFICCSLSVLLHPHHTDPSATRFQNIQRKTCTFQCQPEWTVNTLDWTTYHQSSLTKHHWLVIHIIAISLKFSSRRSVFCSRAQNFNLHKPSNRTVYGDDIQPPFWSSYSLKQY